MLKRYKSESGCACGETERRARLPQPADPVRVAACVGSVRSGGHWDVVRRLLGAAQLVQTTLRMNVQMWFPWLAAMMMAGGGAGCETSASMGRTKVGSSELTPVDVTGREGARPAPASADHEHGPIRVEELEGTHPPVFVLRGRGIGPGKLVFLHGMCGHGLGYAQSFQHAAASKGRLIAPQADVVCGDGPGAKWSTDVAAIDARITAAFRELGHEEPISDVAVLGMSQGATRAAALARTFPERYTRLVSMGAPSAVKAAGLEHLRAAVLMVGQRERKDLMLSSERSLQGKDVPAKSLIIPDADHAGMGPTPEQTMAEALEWLWDNSKAEVVSEPP